MHDFEYKENARKLLTPEIVNLLSSIYEHKGRRKVSYLVACSEVC